LINISYFNKQHSNSLHQTTPRTNLGVHDPITARQFAALSPNLASSADLVHNSTLASYTDPKLSQKLKSDRLEEIHQSWSYWDRYGYAADSHWAAR
jgi:hypothetical protein